ncbi:MAG TPA: pyridoxal-phosphate dependent enzyme, partial [Polyangia bacterium]|nr:pyridoxal-phosphate dependent enzyme [Polyangia bacterium]
HSTNNRQVIAGAGTLTLELLAEQPRLDALVVAVGGGSQAVGALTVARALRPELPVYGVQAERASAIHDSFHARAPMAKSSADTFADGLATRNTYPMTFGALCEGLAGFVVASEAELAEAVRLLVRATHNLAEGAGAAGLAGLLKLSATLAGKRVGIILSGANIDEKTLRAIVSHEL